MVTIWNRPPSTITLPPGEVHVWRAELDKDSTDLHALRSFLAADEKLRADRLYSPLHRRRFTIARGTLRVLLGRYLKTAPETLTFSYHANGKPRLKKTSSLRDRLSFNLSHSGNVALYAIAGDGVEVGIDVERVRDNFDCAALAQRFFAPEEIAALQLLPERSRTEAFFKCWTRKEAYIKGIGKGLTVSLDQFAVSMLPDEPARLVRHAKDPLESSRWSLVDLVPAPGCFAALAVAGHDWLVKCWDWADEAPGSPHFSVRKCSN